MNIPIRTLIVDDETDAVNFIRSIIGEYCPDLEIVGLANSAGEGVQMILKHHPDLVFLDVEMPHGSGFDLLARFPEKMFDVIFITAFNQYALKAIKFSAADYILKPVNINEFIEAVQKVTEKRLQGFSRNTGYHELLENLKSVLPTRLAIPVSDGLEYLNAREIIRIEADRSYSRFFLVNNKRYLVSKNLKEYQDLLTGCNFFRPHHSHLINLEYVKKYIRQEGGYIEMSDGSRVPLSRVKRELFVQQMTRLGRK